MKMSRDAIRPTRNQTRDKFGEKGLLEGFEIDGISDAPNPGQLSRLPSRRVNASPSHTLRRNMSAERPCPASHLPVLARFRHGQLQHFLRPRLAGIQSQLQLEGLCFRSWGFVDWIFKRSPANTGGTKYGATRWGVPGAPWRGAGERFLGL